MNEFVEQCRREWKRLGVPDQVAEEMAAELRADLVEAEGDGVTVQELLGTSASDPRAFAAAWAAERGFAGGGSARRRPFALTAFTALAAVAVLVAALLLATGEPKVQLVSSGPPGMPVPTPHVVQASAATPVEWILLVVAAAGLVFAARLWSRRVAAATRSS